MSDIQGQLSLQNRLLQSIKDELAGLKRAFALAETSREDRFNAALKRLRSEFDMDRLDIMAANVLSTADTVFRDSRRLAAIMAHLGIPDVESDEEGPL
jgi:hypothetical protein